jgi:glucan phosphoethanolaminetransferase (alkaline phosphatase superfamily)
VDQLTIRSMTLRADDFVTWRFWANQVLSLFFIYGLLLLIVRSLQWGGVKSRPFLKRWLLLANVVELLVILAVQANHFLIYQKPVSSFSVRFLFENPMLTAQLSGENIQILQTFLRVGPGLLLFALFFATIDRAQQVDAKRLLLGSFLFLSSVCVSAFAWFSAPLVQHSLLSATTAFADLLRVPNSGLGAGTGLQNRQRIPLNQLTCRSKNEAHAESRSVIWVVGESVVASRLAIYGHSRPTTEFLSEELKQGRLIRFSDVVSIGTVTRISLPYLFFGMQGPDGSGRIFSRPSIFDFAKAAGLKTAFIGSQELRWGNQDKIIINENVDIYMSGTDFDRNAGVSKGADDFEVLNRGVIPYLNSVDAPFFATFHMDGSHYPYAKHSHPRFKKFLPEQTANDANAYDNTLVQLDAYFKELMQVVRSKHPRAWVFYTSDHGQNISKGVKFNSGFAQDVIRVPLFVFPPADELKAVSKVQKMKRQTLAPVSHADLFATTLDVLGCQRENFIDGRDSLSLFAPIPSQRLRVVSELMSSHFVDDRFVVVTSSGRLYEVNADKKTVTLPQGEVLRLSDWYEDHDRHSRIKAEVERLMTR